MMKKHEKKVPTKCPWSQIALDAKCDPQNDHIHKGILTPIILEKSRASLRWALRMGAHLAGKREEEEEQQEEEEEEEEGRTKRKKHHG